MEFAFIQLEVSDIYVSIIRIARETGSFQCELKLCYANAEKHRLCELMSFFGEIRYWKLEIIT